MTITRGFDFVGEMHSGVPSKILHGFWLAGVLPSYLPLGNIGALENVEVFFDSPVAGFGNGASPGEMIGSFSQNAIFRSDNWPGELTNVLRVAAPCVLRDVDIAGTPAQELVLDFADPERLSVQWDDTTAAVLIEAVIIGELRGRLTQLARSIPLAPVLLGHPLRFFPIDGEGALALKLYCNLDNRDGVPPDGKQDALLDPFPLKPWLPDDLAVGINGDVLLNLARQVLADEGIVNGATIVDDYGKKLIDISASGQVTIDTGIGLSFLPDTITLPLSIDLSPTIERIELTSEPSISLHLGYLRVRGSVFVAIDNAFDVDADFDVKVGLSIKDRKVVAFVQHADVDVDTTVYQVLAGLLFLPLALLIANAVDSAIDKLASDAVQGLEFSEDIPVETIVFGGVALTDDTADNAFAQMLEESETPPGRPVIIRVVPTNIFVRADAVVFQMTVHADAPGAAPLVRPQYHIGHKKTMQVHAPGCEFGNRIKWENREFFVRASEAVAAGYDGCRRCLMPLDGEGVGALSVRYWRAVGLKKKRSTAIKVSGTFIAGTKQAAFRKPWAEEGNLITSNHEGVWTEVFGIPMLAPGQWEVTVVDGDWSASKKVAVVGGQLASLGFTYGKDAPATGISVGKIKVVYRAPLVSHLKKKIDVLFEGKWAGAPLPETEITHWTRKAVVDFEIEAGVRAQQVELFVPAGAWSVSVLEYGKLQQLTVEVAPGGDTLLTFERP